MRNAFLIPAFLLGSLAVALCQPALPQNIRATNTLDRLLDFDGINNYDVLYGIPAENSKHVVGDTYLIAQWQKSTLLLADQKLLEGYLIRYNIHANELEVKTRTGIKVIYAKAVKSFITVDSATQAAKYFVSATAFKDHDGGTMDGFFQVLADGSIPLVKKTFIEVRKADYKVQFDMGSRDDKILKKEKYFYLKGNVAHELPAQKKKLIPVFGDRATEAANFIKVNGLSLKEEDHLKALFEHYNKLVKS
jgi:hypothetical protein